MRDPMRTVTIAVLLAVAADCSSEAPKPPPKAAPVPPVASRTDAAPPAAVPSKAPEQKPAVDLAAEERRRLLAYDKSKMSKHSSVLAFVKKTRKAFDDAAAKAKGKPDAQSRIEKLQRSLTKTVEAQGRVVSSIDPRGGNSKLVGDFNRLLVSFGSDYPGSIVASFGGDEGALNETRARTDALISGIEAWLDEAKKVK